MSAIIGRVLLTVGLGIAAAIAYTLFESNRREQHSHRQGGGRRPPPRNSNDDDLHRGGSRGWGGDDHENEIQLGKRESSDSFHSATETVDDPEEDNDIQNKCPVCFETFVNLKRKRIPIFATPCGHVHCEPCVQGSIRSGSNCSLCRKPIKMDRCTRLFM